MLTNGTCGTWFAQTLLALSTYNDNGVVVRVNGLPPLMNLPLTGKA
jgi:hypothetical protein